MKKTKRVAECGMLAALSIIVLLLGAVFEPLDLTTAFLAGFSVLAIRLRWGRASGLLLYFSTATLAFLLLHNKLPAVLYMFYGGLYPLVKVECQRLFNRPLQWLIEIAFSCVAYTAMIFVSLNVFGLTNMDFTYSVVAYIAVAFVAICVDVAVDMLVQQFGHILLRKRK